MPTFYVSLILTLNDFLEERSQVRASYLRLNFREINLKQGTKYHGAMPVITALCAAALLATCGGGSGSGGGDGSGSGSAEATRASASTEPVPPATPEQEVTPPQSESAAPPAATTCGLPNFQSEVIRLVNEMRSASRYCGTALHQPASALEWNSKLFAAAAGHATDRRAKTIFLIQATMAELRASVSRKQATTGRPPGKT